MVRYYNGEHETLCNIFYDAVHNGAANFYTKQQVEAWAPLPIPYEKWKWRFEAKRPFVITCDGIIAGFIELDQDGHIDCHYVATTYSRRGLGGELLNHVVEIAQKLGWGSLYVEASHVAKGLYLKNGFQVDRKNTVERNGVHLENFTMTRTFS